jgi:hypothetical protein
MVKGGSTICTSLSHCTNRKVGVRQTASYANWPLDASAVNTTNRYLIISDNTETDENIRNIIRVPGPSSSSLARVIFTGFPPPPAFVDTAKQFFNECYYRKLDIVKLCVSFHGNINADRAENCAEVSN